MKNRMRQFLISAAFAVMMAIFLPAGIMTSYAADGRIAFSDKTAAVGSEVEINMKVTMTGDGALSNATVMLSYDSSKLEFVSGTGASGGAGSIRITVGGDTADAKELSSKLKFKTIQAGASKVTVNTQEVYDSSNQVVNITQLGSSTITAQAPANASSEASLAGLQVSPGSLTPDFSPDVFVYTANVDEDVTKITVDAPAKDEKASVVLSGNEDLQPGDNRVVCRVVAEDGTTIKEYVITVIRAGDGSQTGGEAPAGSIAVETPAKTVTIIPLDEGVSIPEGFAECTIKIDGQDVQGWIWATDTEHKYCVFYGMNENGEKDFYRYDLAEKTMQRYFHDPTIETNVSMEDFAKLAEEHNPLLEDYQLRLYIIVGLGVVAVVLLIIVIVLFSTRKRDGDDEYTNYEEKLNDRKEPVRRASEGLPSQRANVRTERPSGRAQMDREAAGRAQMDREAAGRAQMDREAAGRAQTDREALDRAQMDRDTAGRAQMDREAAGRVQMDREPSGRAQAAREPVEQRTRAAQTSVTEEQLRELQSMMQEEEPAQPSSTRQNTFVPKPIVTVAAVQRQPIPQTSLQQRPAARPAPKPAPQPAPKPPVQPPTFGYEVDDDDDGFEFLDLD